MLRTRLFIQTGTYKFKHAGAKGIMMLFKFCSPTVSTLCRPLPRGLIRYDEARTVIWMSLLTMVIYGLLLGVRFSWPTGFFFLLSVTMQCTVIV